MEVGSKITQLNLFGTQGDKEVIEAEIKSLEEWITEIEWGLSDKCKWTESEKSEWYIRTRGGGGIDANTMEEEFKNAIKYAKVMIDEHKQELVGEKWGLK